MRGKCRTAAVVLLWALFLTSIATGLLAASAGSYAYIYMPGIPGGAEDPAHRNWIEALSCDWGSIPPPRGSMVPAQGNGRAGKLHFGQFSFLKHTDGSSWMLSRCCERRITLSHIRLESADTAMGRFRSLVLRKVEIISVRPGKAPVKGRSTEVVTVGFKQVEYQ